MASKETFSERKFKALYSLYSQGEESWATLVTAIANAKPRLKPADFIEEVVGNLKSKISGIDEIVRALLYIYHDYYHDRVMVSEIISDCIEGLVDWSKQDKDQAIAYDDLSTYSKMLESILSQDDTLGISAKAVSVMFHHQKPYICSHLYSDIRSIFNDSDLAAAPKAAVITHDLCIVYSDNRENKEIYVTLDYDDLYELSEIIEKAKLKHENLASSLKNSGTLHLE